MSEPEQPVPAQEPMGNAPSVHPAVGEGDDVSYAPAAAAIVATPTNESDDPATAAVNGDGASTPSLTQDPDSKDDVAMLDVPTDEQAASPLPTAVPPNTSTVTTTAAAPFGGNSNAPSPLPARVSTPMRNTAAGDERMGSRAASTHPDPAGGFTMPAEAPPHGAPVRQYINSKITGVLLEGMKMVAKEQ
ncbi:hypothetical protein B0H63DRAFT_516385 [Podospora didyma]|uniref:Uncharacterized protein n=1 Tax=Podospora didyma TaxID=330526 RepID=A0AAE0U6Z5_9PEZI|nr:hypothetical protein B0H63DRAFT_516385 [Podospora didyma]